MKKLVFIGSLLLILSASKNVSGQVLKSEGPEITPPSLISSYYSDLNDLLQASLEYPLYSLKSGIQGTVVVSYAVSASGTIEEVVVLNSLSKEIDREVIRLIENTSGKWEPGTIDGLPSKMAQEIHLSFVLFSFDQMLAKAKYYIQKGNKWMYEKDDPEKALQFYNMAYTLLPNDESVQLQRKYCLERLGLLAEAEKAEERLEFLAQQNIGF